MFRAYLPKALALTVLTAGLAVAGAQQTQPAPDAGTPQSTEMQHHHHPRNPQREAAFLTKKLNLTPDQTAKVEPILANRDQQMDALHGNAALTPEDRHQQMRTIHQQTEQQMAGILTPDQLTQLKSMRHHGHGHHGPDQQPGNDGQSPS